MIVCGWPDSASSSQRPSFSSLPCSNASANRSISFHPATEVAPAATTIRQSEPASSRFQ